MVRMDLPEFQRIVYPLKNKLFRFAKRFLDHTEEAEDIVQEVFVALWQKAHLYEAGKGKPLTWLTTMARNRAIEALTRVGIPEPALRYDAFPHQLSGGMRQRAMIAIAIVCEPRILIADEPTTALDVTVQAQIVDVLGDLCARLGMAMLFITHDLGLVAQTCTRLLTMYAGEVVEQGAIDDVLVRPRHPYSSSLLLSLPALSARKVRLPAIPGRVPTQAEMPAGCRFGPRCTHARPPCGDVQHLAPVGAGARVRCCRSAEIVLPGELKRAVA